jgi:hypothetical protein
LGFEKNANFFRRKLAKIAENCDHNIDPRQKRLGFLRSLVYESGHTGPMSGFRTRYWVTEIEVAALEEACLNTGDTFFS